MKIRKKPMIIDAVFTEEDGEVETLAGRVHYKKGDVIATGILGERYPIRRDVFFKTYDIVYECPICNSYNTYIDGTIFKHKCIDCSWSWDR
jgi:hypothetical protein